jgi:hypothetical protein
VILELIRFTVILIIKFINVFINVIYSSLIFFMLYLLCYSYFLTLII